MFEISWSELLILGIVTLIFVGPKELPVFLRTLGKYAGSLRRQANEFKSHFDSAMREAELDTMREEMQAMQTSVNSEIMSAKQVIQQAATPPLPTTPAEVPKSILAAASNEPAVSMPPMPAPPRMET